MKLEKFKGNQLTQIKEQVVIINRPYDLVRLTDAIEATENHVEIIAQMLADLIKFLNISRKMNHVQVFETIEMMLREFPGFTLQEYQVFFNRIKNGSYGNLYDSIDGVKIMVFLREFHKEILKEYHDFKTENHAKIKRDEEHRDL